LQPQDVVRWKQPADRARAFWKEAEVPMDRRRPMLLEALNRLYEEKK
jgi:hypothetical protein